MRSPFIIKEISLILIISFLILSTCFLSCRQPINFEHENEPVSITPSPDINGTPESTQIQQQRSDFSVITLGTGGPNYNLERSGPSTLILYKNIFIKISWIRHIYSIA